ncbi:hypothetical protein GQ43DRAFT_484847 [Delitschia confertaspora ATCC 74209]|uniref:Uncharacterized protein n=1 Tax=Delitschia confertaspora ATCC 74209 TaxID=1513339 RepID=A0A9P4JG05_9PLEO|nr:hypothetical protein GQ43DRAFT_484847 [Delitschia confertaspora ATCC 74209]
MWFAAFEAWAVQKLVRSPLFNQAIHKVYRKVNGLPPIEPQNGGGRTGPSALDHFKDEVKDQLKVMFWQQKPKK